MTGTQPQGPQPPATIFFLSDYGLRDEFVGVVHAVLRRRAPGAVVIDLTHEIAPFDVRAGSAALARALPHLGEGVVLAVVDPGVGGSRSAIALETRAASGPRWWVGPDNGLLLGAAEAGGPVLAVADLRPPRTGGERAGTSVTFDGRDVFAPAAAALCAGAALASLGPALDPSRVVRVPAPVCDAGTLPDGRSLLRVEVTWVDRFGNAQLGVTRGAVPPDVDLVTVDLDPAAPAPSPGGGAWGGPEAVRRVRSFPDLARGEAGLLVDANGFLALVVAEGSAAARFGIAAGSLVQLVW
ncbi:MAG TPA: SAM-dependent chlorinase/fluorinase [Acidimicrobiales bacterium]|nr:SAM-dependent chlorinase/fluorinase [Acidimicrobiales bacterium]